MQVIFEWSGVYLNRYVEPDSFMATIQILMAGGLGGAAVVYIAAYVAPSHRVWIAILLSVIAVGNTFLAIQMARAGGDWLSVLLDLTQTGVGVFLTYLIIRKRITFDDV